MNFVRRLLAAGSLYLVATLAPTLTLLAVTPLVTRGLGAAEYGEVAIAITIYQLSAMLVTFGLPLAVTRHALLGKGGFGVANGIVLVGSLGAVICGLALAATASWWGAAIFPSVPSVVLSWGVIAGMGLSIVVLSQAMFRAAERVGAYVVMAIAASLIPPALGLSLMKGISSDAETYSFGLAAGYVVVAVIALTIAVQHHRPRLSFRETLAAYRIGLPTLPHLASLPLMVTGALSIVTTSNDTTMAAELQLTILLGSSVLTVLNALNNAWAPMIMKTSGENRPRVLEDSTYAVSVVALCISSAYIIIAPFAMRLIGGPVIQSDVPERASLLVAISAAFQVLYLANIHLTFIGGRTGPLALTTPLSAALALVTIQFVTQLKQNDLTLLLYALAWPIFFALQALWSAILARRTPFPSPRVMRSLVPLALSIGLCAVCAVFTPPIALTVSFVGVSLLICALQLWLKHRLS